MGFLPVSASFEEQVADFFSLVRGHGLMLSPLDRELLTEWSQVGAPFEVVARGIRRAAEKAAYDARAGAALRSLRACKREVDAEIKKYLARSAGTTATGGRNEIAAPPKTIEEERIARIGKLVRSLATQRAQLQPACADILSRLPGASGSQHLEDLVLARLLRALPLEERRSLNAEARRAATQTSVSHRGRKLSVRVHRAAAVRRTLDLPAFW